MKTDQLIVQYLYLNKKVSLQDIGTFIISSDINIPMDVEKDTVLPPDYIQFTYDPKAVVDEGLINFIISNTRKIRPLATSDLESFIILNKQFLNIGKPLILEGLGTLQKTQQGEFSFVQAHTSHVINEETPKLVTEKVKEKITFATPPKEKSSGDNINLTKVVIVAAILIAIAGISYYLVSKSNKAEPVADATAVNEDSKVVTADTSATIVPTTTTATIPNSTDSNSFYVVIKEFNDLALAQRSVQRLSNYGHKVILSTKDSASYKVRMPFKTGIADTVVIKDSLGKFFQAKPYIELP